MGFFGSAIDYFFRGGPCMWPLLLCSFAAIIVGLERIFYYNQTMSSDSFVTEFRDAMNDLAHDKALDLAKEAKGEVAQMAADMLTKEVDGCLGVRYENMVYGKADRIIDAWEKHLGYLDVIVGLSPMLGLLGTITGMIASFNALNDRLSNPLAVTAGIGEALITTVFGLIISIIGMCIHSYLSSRLKSATLGVNEVADVLVNIHSLEHHM